MTRFAALLAAILMASCSNTTVLDTASRSGDRATRSGTGSGTVMVTGGHAFAPPAFYKFCRTHRSLCSTAGGTRSVQLTPARKAELAQVNKAVNRRVREVPDLHGDVWSVAARTGDCEDFAIAKKAELLARGWPASALLLTVATYGGEGHTVLTVRTSDGDLVLDNRTGAIKDWSRTPYRYFARQTQGGGSKWVRIGTGKPVASSVS